VARRPDSEVIAVRAISARQRGPAGLARILGLDRNPLRRASDRAEAWIRIGVLAAFLVAGPLAAIGAGHWAYHSGIIEAHAQAGQTYSVRAVLPQPASPAADLTAASRGGQAWVRARWLSTGVSPRIGEVLAPIGSAAGSVVTVWLDASGKLAARSLQPGQVTSQTVMVAALTPVLVALAFLIAVRLNRSSPQ
jgi:hypothetical protein